MFRYIDEKFKKNEERIIAFCLVDGSHMREVIVKEIINKLFEWNIFDKNIFSIVLDNASVNNVSSFFCVVHIF